MHYRLIIKQTVTVAIELVNWLTDHGIELAELDFGQQIEDVVALTWDDVKVSDEIVPVRMGKTEIAIPDPLDQPWRELAADPAARAGIGPMADSHVPMLEMLWEAHDPHGALDWHSCRRATTPQGGRHLATCSRSCQFK